MAGQRKFTTNRHNTLKTQLREFYCFLNFSIVYKSILFDYICLFMPVLHLRQVGIKKYKSGKPKQ